MNKENVLLIFTRNPELGKVKTRLAATVGAAHALKIYETLVAHTQTIAAALPCRKIVLYDRFINQHDEWEAATYEKQLQIFGDLGQKMQQAFREAFANGAKKVVIIGTDCYELTQAIITDAFRNLATNAATIGPARDGGYYLLGLTQFCPEFFENKAWSTNAVFEATCQDFRRLKLSYNVLPTLSDVDEEADLGSLRTLLS